MIHFTDCAFFKFEVCCTSTMDLIYVWEKDLTYIWDIGWWHERGSPRQLLPWEGMWWAQAWSSLRPALWAQWAATLSDRSLLHSLPSWSISPSHPASVQSKLIRNSWPLHLLSPYSLLAAVNMPKFWTKYLFAGHWSNHSLKALLCHLGIKYIEGLRDLLRSK